MEISMFQEAKCKLWLKDVMGKRTEMWIRNENEKHRVHFIFLDNKNFLLIWKILLNVEICGLKYIMECKM